MDRIQAEELQDELNSINIRCDPDVWYVGISTLDTNQYAVRLGIQHDNWETLRFPKEVVEWIRENGYGLYNVHHNEKMGLFADVLPIDEQDQDSELGHTLEFERRSTDGQNYYYFKMSDGRKVKLPPGTTVSELQNRI